MILWKVVFKNMKRSSYKNKNNSNLKIWLIILGVIVLVLASGGGYVAYTRWQERQEAQRRYEAAESVVDRFIDALEAGDFEEFTALLSSESIQEADYSQEELSERYEIIFSGIGASNFEVSTVEFMLNEESDVFEFSYQLSMNTSLGRLDDISYSTVLHESGEDFSVHWEYDLIFPDMQAEDSVRLSYDEGQRGNIYDRYGNMIAGEGTAMQAGLYPAALGDGETLQSQLEAISSAFGRSVSSLENLLNQSWVTEESFVPFLIVDEGDTPELTGVLYQQTTARIYPIAEAAAHLTGYVGEVTAEDLEAHPTLQSGDIIGRAGLEAAFDEQLRGTKGGRIFIEDGEGEIRTVLIESEIENGENIHMTIDLELQQLMYDQMNGDSGAVVVTDPITGEILVATSSPSYDPGLFTRGITSEEYNAYAENEDAPFLARYSSRYAPGSTFKIITAMIGLDSGITTEEETHTIEGLQWSPDDASWGNHEITRVSDAVSEVNLQTALVYSDNIYFAMEGLEMGEDIFLEGLSQFPFGAGLNLPFNMQSAQITNSGEFDNEPLLADTAYGQGQLLMSPIHQAVFYSPVVNNGELVMPTLILDDQTETVLLVSEEAASIVHDNLILAVEDENGTANALSGTSFTLGAKTGTAEILGADGENVTNGFLYAFDAQDNDFSFVGFLEGYRSGDVVERFEPIMEELKSATN